MVAVSEEEFLSWYLMTLRNSRGESQETGIDITHHSGPSTSTPNLHVPSEKPLIPTKNRPHQDPSQDPEVNLLERNEVSTIQSEHVPTAITESVPEPENSDLFIQQMLQEAEYLVESNPWEKLSIYRVPKTMREGNEKSYVPQMVSIGPFHHGKRQLADMELHKWRAMYEVLRRTGHDIKQYINAILPLENRVRSCYEGPILMSSDKFVLSLVLDGIFVLELFIGVTNRIGFIGLGYSLNDPIFSFRSTIQTVRNDMIMLENQIPLFVLDRLLAVQLGGPNRLAMVSRLAVSFFNPLMPTYEHDSISYESDEVFDPHSDVGQHCLDAFRLSLLKTSTKLHDIADNGSHLLMQCASKLRKAGIRCTTKNSDCFWDIKFKKDGILQIPRILIHNGTKSLFLNLIAFEQCHVNEAKMVTSYVIFMGNLISTEEDVRYLHDRGIIEHCLATDKDVADLFGRLCQEVVIDFYNCDLYGVSHRVNQYYKNKLWNIRRYDWYAILMKNYLSNPWTIISIVAGVVLLLLTSGQTFYTVYAYYRPPS